MLKESVDRLAAPPDVQNRYIANGHFHHDELALELDGVREAATWQCELPDDAVAALAALDGQLLLMSGQENAELWTDEGVATAQQWQVVRELASLAAARLEEWSGRGLGLPDGAA